MRTLNSTQSILNQSTITNINRNRSHTAAQRTHPHSHSPPTHQNMTSHIQRRIQRHTIRMLQNTSRINHHSLTSLSHITTPQRTLHITNRHHSRQHRQRHLFKQNLQHLRTQRHRRILSSLNRPPQLNTRIIRSQHRTKHLIKLSRIRMTIRRHRQHTRLIQSINSRITPRLLRPHRRTSITRSRRPLLTTMKRRPRHRPRTLILKQKRIRRQLPFQRINRPNTRLQIQRRIISRTSTITHRLRPRRPPNNTVRPSSLTLHIRRSRDIQRHVHNLTRNTRRPRRTTLTHSHNTRTRISRLNSLTPHTSRIQQHRTLPQLRPSTRAMRIRRQRRHMTRRHRSRHPFSITRHRTNQHHNHRRRNRANRQNLPNKTKRRVRTRHHRNCSVKIPNVSQPNTTPPHIPTRVIIRGQ